MGGRLGSRDYWISGMRVEVAAIRQRDEIYLGQMRRTRGVDAGLDQVSSCEAGGPYKCLMSVEREGKIRDEDEEADADCPSGCYHAAMLILHSHAIETMSGLLHPLTLSFNA